jgi:hypothetical protein
LVKKVTRITYDSAMASPPQGWSNQPNLIVLLAKLQELSLRLARLELHERAQRAQALVRAHKPR